VSRVKKSRIELWRVSIGRMSLCSMILEMVEYDMK
jgi:hypothetical protein